jgi:hypothetical protein
MHRTGNVFEWVMRGGDQEDDDQSMGPEDYAWSANHFRSRSVRVPNLEWVWDLSARDLMAYRLSVALRQRLGSA